MGLNKDWGRRAESVYREIERLTQFGTYARVQMTVSNHTATAWSSTANSCQNFSLWSLVVLTQVGKPIYSKRWSYCIPLFSLFSWVTILTILVFPAQIPNVLQMRILNMFRLCNNITQPQKNQESCHKSPQIMYV